MQINLNQRQSPTGRAEVNLLPISFLVFYFSPIELVSNFNGRFPMRRFNYQTTASLDFVSYQDLIIEMVTKSLREHLDYWEIERSNGRRSFLEKGLLFWTVTFNQKFAGTKHTYKDFASNRFFDVTKHLYCQLCANLIGNNWDRNDFVQPTTFAFLDFQGSKTGRCRRIPLVGAHTHNLTWVRPDQITRLGTLLNEDILKRKFEGDSRVDEVKLELFDPQKGSLGGLISYCSKFCSANYNEQDQIGDLFAVYPIKKF